MILSACLLTRNEAKNLERALGSLKGIADEVIVADTGSTDGTVALAQQLGARTLDVGWDDDFSKGRNDALAAARGDWILWFNPDEEFERSTEAALRWCLAQPTALAWHVRVWDFIRPEPNAYTETLQPRLFRNGRDVRYRARLHNDFEEPLDELAARYGMSIGVSQVLLRRHAYLSQLTPDKLRWAARLLEKELADRPGQLHFLIEYGRTLLLLQDARAKEVFTEAAQQVLRAANAPRAPTANVGLLLEHVLMSANASGLPLSVDQAKELAHRWFPATPPVLWALALTEFRGNRFAEAIPFLERLTQMGATGQYDRSAAFEPGIIGGFAWQNLGVCYSRLGDWARAEICFGKMMTLPGYQQVGRQHYAWVQGQKQKSSSGSRN